MSIPSPSRSAMSRSKIGFPILVAGEIVVGDEEAVDALGDVAADDLLDVVGAAPPRFASLHVDDRAEAALEGAAAAGIEAREVRRSCAECAAPAGSAPACPRGSAGRSCNCKAASARPATRRAAHRRAGLRPRRRRARCRAPALRAARAASRAASPACRRHGSRRCRPARRAVRSRRATSIARGYWFDCTPTSPTMPASAPATRRAMRSGRMRVLVSS